MFFLSSPFFFFFFFFFNDTATTEIYTLSLHDALPTCSPRIRRFRLSGSGSSTTASTPPSTPRTRPPTCRSEEHTSELQSRRDLVCRLLLEKKKETEKVFRFMYKQIAIHHY